MAYWCNKNHFAKKQNGISTIWDEGAPSFRKCVTQKVISLAWPGSEAKYLSCLRVRLQYLFSPFMLLLPLLWLYTVSYFQILLAL